MSNAEKNYMEIELTNIQKTILDNVEKYLQNSITNNVIIYLSEQIKNSEKDKDVKFLSFIMYDYEYNWEILFYADYEKNSDKISSADSIINDHFLDEIIQGQGIKEIEDKISLDEYYFYDKDYPSVLKFLFPYELLKIYLKWFYKCWSLAGGKESIYDSYLYIQEESFDYFNLKKLLFIGQKYENLNLIIEEININSEEGINKRLDFYLQKVYFDENYKYY